MRTILILLLLVAPAGAAKWDLDNLTPSQRTSLIIMRDRWNNGYRGTPPCPPCSGVKHVWYDGRVKRSQSGHNPDTIRPYPATYGRVKAPIRTFPDTYGGGPLTILNPFVSKAEGGGK